MIAKFPQPALQLLCLLAPLLGGVASGCGAKTTGNSDLVDHDFLLDSAEGFTPVTDTTVRISFGASEFTFSAGCNGHFGEYSLCDSRLCVDSFGATTIGCPQELQAQDEWLATFFTSEPNLEHEGDRLTISNDSATLEFLDAEVKNPDRTLTGRLWVIDAFITGDAVSNLRLSVDPTVEFSDEGTLDVFTTCVSAAGTFTAAGQTLTLSGLNYDEPACPETGSMTADEHIKQVLAEGTVTFEIDEQRLTLTRGELGLFARTE